MITFAYKVGGWAEKRPKICLRNKSFGKLKQLLLLNIPETKSYDIYIDFYSRYIQSVPPICGFKK